MPLADDARPATGDDPPPPVSRAAVGGAAVGGVTWGAMDAADLTDLVALTHRVLAVDGGLPLAADAGFLRRRYAGPDVVAVTARDAAGRLLAAGSARPTGDDVTVTGQVDPQARGRGLGAHLLDWGLGEAARRGAAVVVETESWTPPAEALFACRGLRRFFAEDIMGIDVAGSLPRPVWPASTTVVEWSDETAARFHAAYHAAFRERPGFPHLSAREWIDDTAEDEGFRADWSLLAHRAGVGDLGFVTAATGWIVQVGVVPAARRGGLGAALVIEALRRMRAGGVDRALLAVNVDNPAARLYRRLGFSSQGRRARFRPEPSSGAGPERTAGGTGGEPAGDSARRP